MNDTRENDDDEGGMGDGSGEFDDEHYGGDGGAGASTPDVELYGTWDNCF